jgi:transcriptional regulator NrdR family protein
MICTECNHKMSCNQTKHFSDPDGGYNYVERRRICDNCGHRIFTVELPQEALSKLKELT